MMFENSIVWISKGNKSKSSNTEESFDFEESSSNIKARTSSTVASSSIENRDSTFHKRKNVQPHPKKEMSFSFSFSQSRLGLHNLSPSPGLP